ncbi:MAG: cell division protein ZipA [SAR86 cluster bacterium]|mgnify:FL=1|uniref:Cell division protein ZipA n=1 Tax=SAR86 cluster bacterium TaxID=2030880 RepID=A0A520N4T3_9GAMM|nr:MAG: cell division protein ZipA [SAR86 cluster bacterium]|tara:strand:- start:670 stop:1284 length:615 start_codon:yes stop_codon:yes gene_type:complete
MGINSEIYLIGLAVLFFLIIVFLFIRKVSNASELKVKIESIPDPLEAIEKDNNLKEEISEDLFESSDNQELACFYLISVDKSMFDIDQIFGFLSNYGAKIKNKYFAFSDSNGTEKFRIINALNPGTFENDTKTFAIVVVADLSVTTDPLITVKKMIEFCIDFSEKFHASLCDEERTPITKQMISHIESKAQDIERINQLKRTES